MRRYDIKRILFFAALFTLIACVLIFDKFRLNNQFETLYYILHNTRLDALYRNHVIIVRFTGNKMIISNKDIQSPDKTFKFSFIKQVNYDTILGNDMIVFDGARGTSDYNIRIHGGDLKLQSWFGFRKYIHVNCNGFIIEGQYPE